MAKKQKHLEEQTEQQPEEQPEAPPETAVSDGVILDPPEEQPTPVAAPVAEGVLYERPLGGLVISAVFEDGREYNRAKHRLISELDGTLSPYTAKGTEINRHDAAMICGVLSIKAKSFGIELVRPFTVKP